MKITYCRQNPKGLICEREQPHSPAVGSYVKLAGIFHQLRHVEHVAREAIAYVMPD